jgi:hypothetical protein
MGSLTFKKDLHFFKQCGTYSLTLATKLWSKWKKMLVRDDAFYKIMKIIFWYFHYFLKINTYICSLFYFYFSQYILFTWRNSIPLLTIKINTNFWKSFREEVKGSYIFPPKLHLDKYIMSLINIYFEINLLYFWSFISYR